MKINAVDLFCGVGGLTYGIQQAGINVVAGYDIDEKSKFAYEYNNDARFILKDIKEIEDDEILELYPSDTDIKVLIGCAPCQPFSTYSHKYQNNENTIKKIDLLDCFGRQVELVKPDIVSMENVPQMQKKRSISSFSHFIRKEWLQGHLQGGICSGLRSASNKKTASFTCVKIRRYFVN